MQNRRYMYDLKKYSMDRLFLYLVCTTLCSHITTHGAFTWLKQPIDNEVHACVGGEAMFRWHYDESIYNVTMVYWRNAKTGETVLGHHILPDEQLKHYFDKYRYRVMLMDPTEANAGLVLMEVTADDAGEYRVELSGPVQAVDTARLIVHSEINPVVSIGYEELTLDQFAAVRKEINWTSEVNITFRSGNVPVDISIELGEDTKTCTAKTECSTQFTPDSEKTEVELRFRIAQEACSPQTFTLYVADESAASGSESNKTAVIVAVVFGVIALLIAVVIAIIVMRQKKRKKRNVEMAYTVNEDLPASAGAPATDKPWLCDVINEINDVTPKPEEDTCEPLLKPETTIECAKEAEKEDELEFPIDDLYKPPVTLLDLLELGYLFNENGELRSADTNEPFEFNKYPEHARNQQRYEELGEAVTKYVYKFMEERLKLKRIYIPADASDDEDRPFFFMSPGALTKDKLMVLIHGSGVVRAGQWARRLIINDDLDKGTQFRYILWGLEHGFGVLVMNTNYKSDVSCAKNPESHASYIWEKFLATTSARIAIVAHSYGGCVVTHLVDNYGQALTDRVFAVAFTDSVHGMGASDTTMEFLAERAINWVSSDQPRDKLTSDVGVKDAKRVSAGHPKHEWTSYAAMESVFRFIEEKLAAAE